MILRMLIPFLLMLVIPDLYISLCYIRHLTTHPLLRAAWWIPTLLLTVWLVFAFAGHLQHLSGMKYGFAMMLCVMIPKLLFCLCSWIGRLLQWVHVPAQRPLDMVGTLGGLVVLGILVYGSAWGWRQLQVRQVTFTSPDVPAAFDGYRIAQITDFHIGTQAGNTPFIQDIVAHVNAQQADMIAFTGDLINGNPDELEPDFIQALSQLQAPDGVFSVLGNHDYCMYGRYDSPRQQAENVQKLKQIEREQLHWQLLLNEHRVLYRGTDSLAVLGVENDGNPPFPQYGDLPRTRQGLQPGCFQLLLSHDPTHWRRRVLPETDIQLMLSGHTHATQFKIGSFSPARFVYPEWDGLFLDGQRGLFVSSGIGEVMFPFRFGAWPEVVVITLKRPTL